MCHLFIIMEDEEVCENSYTIVTTAMYSSVKYGFKIEKYTLSSM